MLKKIGLVALLGGMLALGEANKPSNINADEKPPLTASNPLYEEESDEPLEERAKESLPVKVPVAEPATSLEHKVELQYVGEHNGQFIGSFDDTYVFYDGKQLEFCDRDFKTKRKIELEMGYSSKLSPCGNFVAGNTSHNDEYEEITNHRRHVILTSNTSHNDEYEAAKFIIYRLNGDSIKEVLSKNAPFLGGVAFSHNGKLFAYTIRPRDQRYNTLILVDTKTWTEIRCFDFEPIYDIETDIEFSDHDRYIVARDCGAAIIDLDDNKSPVTHLSMFYVIGEGDYHSLGGNITFVGNNKVAGGYSYGHIHAPESPEERPAKEDIFKVHVYDFKKNEVVKELLQGGRPVVSCLPNGYLIVGGGKEIRLYDPNFDLIQKIAINHTCDNSLKTSYDNKFVFAGSGSRTSSGVTTIFSVK